MTTEPLPRSPRADGGRTARPESEEASPRWRQLLSGVRTRILAWFVILMTLATFLSLFILRQALLAQLDERINFDLAQEVTELRQLVGGTYPDGTCVTDRDRDGTCDIGRNPDTGEPFGDNIKALFETFLRRNLPANHEVLLTFVDGELFRVSRQAPAAMLLAHPTFADLGDLTEATARGEPDIADVGPVRYLAVPILGGRGQPLGVFVVAQLVQPQLADMEDATQVAAGVLLGVLVVASALAYLVAGRALAQVRLVTDTARSISDSDLNRRIPVEGDDEISRLSRTFNEMLDRLEHAFATQRTFLDDAGHELRTPITIIRGHLELLEDDPEERRETVAIVTDELDRMARMVEDLLVLAQARRPDFLTFDTVEISELTETLHIKATALAKRSWELESVGKGRVVADRQRLTQAVVQLAQNATQHTVEGGRIALGSRLLDGEARFWVRDSGPGVAPEDTVRIFGRFARAGGSGRRSGGAGLGLSIVRVIAEAHRGRVELDSRPGHGATFTIVIPVDQPILPDLGDVP